MDNKRQINSFIPIENKLNEFHHYLKINDRCIFSAKFGDGKSYFLSQFMSQYKDKYFFIPIYPVNYQVAENKDIFEYIKRDILIRLLMADETEIDDLEISESLFFSFYLLYHTKDFITDILQVLPSIEIWGISINLGKLSSGILTLKQKFDKFKEKHASEKNKIEKYIIEFSQQKGSIYEFDFISQLISLINDRLRKKHKQKIVLVIEDLDRIDPAHIFRILNIFSAHFDWFNMPTDEFEQCYYSNKFKFDKIITVCDYENIKHIYAHFYGPDTDFEGYISKYSTSFPFKYSIRKALQEYISANMNPQLAKYEILRSRLSKIVAENILSDNSTKNLRDLNECLISPPAVIKEKIKIFDGKYYIWSDNIFTILLDFLRKFNIPLGEVLSSQKLDIYNIINIAWLILDGVNGGFVINKSARIGISIPGYVTDYFSDIKVNTLAPSEIVDIDINPILGYNAYNKFFDSYVKEINLYYTKYLINYDK